jgi:hypothetical protein
MNASDYAKALYTATTGKADDTAVAVTDRFVELVRSRGHTKRR